MTKLEAGQPFGAQIHFSNVGKTNAKALKGRACLGHGVTLDPNQECVEPTYISVEDLGPTVGRSYIITLKPPPTKELVDVIMSGRERYFVFGWVTYEDMIGLSHRTEFCGEYDTRARGPMYATLCDSRNKSH